MTTRPRIHRPILCSVLALAVLVAWSGPSAAQETPGPPPAPPAPRAPEAPRPPQAPRARPLVFGFMLKAGPPPVVLEVVPASAVARAGIQAGDVLVSVDGRAATIASIREAGRRSAPRDTVRFRIRRNGQEREIPVILERHERIVVAPRARHRARVVPRGSRERIVIDSDSIRALVRLYLDGARKDLEDLDIKLDLDLQGELELEKFDWDELEDAIEESMEGLGPAMEALARDLDGRLLALQAPEIEFRLGASRAIAGAALTDLDPKLASYFPGVGRGVLVLRVREGSEAAEAGLSPGDVIVAVDGEPIDDLSELSRELREGDDEEARELTVIRHGERRALSLPD